MNLQQEEIGTFARQIQFETIVTSPSRLIFCVRAMSSSCGPRVVKDKLASLSKAYTKAKKAHEDAIKTLETAAMNPKSTKEEVGSLINMVRRRASDLHVQHEDAMTAYAVNCNHSQFLMKKLDAVSDCLLSASVELAAVDELD